MKNIIQTEIDPLLSKTKPTAEDDRIARPSLGERRNAQGNDHLSNFQFTEAFRLFEEAADLNNSDAQYMLGRLYEQGVFKPKNIERAKKYYEKAKENDANLHASLRLAILAKNEAEIFSVSKLLAEKKDPKGTYQLALCYAKGIGSEQDSKSAKEYYEKAEVYGSYDAAIHLLPQSTYLEAKKNLETLLTYVDNAARQGDIDALHAFGNYILTNDGSQPEYLSYLHFSNKRNRYGLAMTPQEVAIEYLEKAANEASHPLAAIRLGEIFEDRAKSGRNLEFYSDERIKYYRTAAKSDPKNVPVQKKLASVLFDEGHRYWQNYAEIVKIYENLALEDDVQSLEMLAWLSITDKNLKKESSDAQKYYERAYERAEALKLKSTLTAPVTPEPKEHESSINEWSIEGIRKKGLCLLAHIYLQKARFEATKKESDPEAVKNADKHVFNLFYKAAKDYKIPEAQYYVGLGYEQGVAGVELNLSEAIKWYSLADAGNNPDATAALKRLTELGEKGLQGKEICLRAHRYLQKARFEAAKKEPDPEAVKNANKQAFELFYTAAEEYKIPEAQYYVWLAYNEGATGIERDLSKAEKWSLLAAAWKNPDAIAALPKLNFAQKVVGKIDIFGIFGRSRPPMPTTVDLPNQNINEENAPQNDELNPNSKKHL